MAIVREVIARAGVVRVAIISVVIVRVGVVRLPVSGRSVVGLSIQTLPLRIVALRLDHFDGPEFPVCPGVQLLPDTSPAAGEQAESQGSLESWAPGARGDMSEATAIALWVGSQRKLGTGS